MSQNAEQKKAAIGFKDLLCFVFSVAIGILLLWTVDILSDCSYDLILWPHQKRTNEEIVVIYLNENCYTKLKQSPSDLSRHWHAELLRQLRLRHAKMVVFDLLFIDRRDDAPGDSELMKELALWKAQEHPVILGGMIEFDPQNNVLPKPPLAMFETNAAGWGLVDIHKSSQIRDFVARRHHPGTERFASLAWTGASALLAPVTESSSNRAIERWLNYYATTPFQRVPFSSVVLQEPLPPQISFSNKVVFVGLGRVASTPGAGTDEHRKPWIGSKDDFLFGVDIHAITFRNLMAGDWLQRFPKGIELLLVAAIAIGVAACLRTRQLKFVLWAALLMLLIPGVGLVSPKFGWWLPWISFEIEAGTVLLVWQTIGSLQTVLQKERTSILFRAPKFVHRCLDLLRPRRLRNAPMPTVSKAIMKPAPVAATQPAPLVVISYSHKDYRSLETFYKTLKPILSADKIRLWHDKEIKTGAAWEDEIDNALASAKVAVLLVSNDFLDSDFIMQREVPAIMKAVESGRITLFWVLLRAIADKSPFGKYQAAHDISKPMNSLKDPQSDAVWADICIKIKAAALSFTPPAPTNSD